MEALDGELDLRFLILTLLLLLKTLLDWYFKENPSFLKLSWRVGASYNVIIVVGRLHILIFRLVSSFLSPNGLLWCIRKVITD